MANIYLYLRRILYNCLLRHSLLLGGGTGLFRSSGRLLGGRLTLALALASGAGGASGASGAGGTLGTNTPRTTTVVHNLQKEIKEAFLVYTGGLHFLENFFTERTHGTIYKNKICF